MYRVMRQVVKDIDTDTYGGRDKGIERSVGRKLMDFIITRGYVPVKPLDIIHLGNLEYKDASRTRFKRYTIYIGKRKARIWLRHQKDKVFSTYDGFGDIRGNAIIV